MIAIGRARPRGAVAARSGGDHDVGGVDPRARRPRAAGPGSSLAVPFRTVIPRVLISPGDAFDQLVDDLVLERPDRGPVGVARRLDAPLLRAVHGVHHGSGLQQCLGGDAAAEETGATQSVVALDDGNAFAQLCRPQGRGIATGAGADHKYVVRVRHRASSLLGIPLDGIPQHRAADTMPSRWRTRAPPIRPTKPRPSPTSSSGPRWRPSISASARRWPPSRDGRCRSSTRARSRSIGPSRSHVGLFDLTHLGKVEVVGAGALGHAATAGHERPLPRPRGRCALQPRVERGRRRDRGPDRLSPRRGALLRRAERLQRAAGAPDARGGEGRRAAPPDVPPGLVLPRGPGSRSDERDRRDCSRRLPTSASCDAWRPSTTAGR